MKKVVPIILGITAVGAMAYLFMNKDNSAGEDLPKEGRNAASSVVPILDGRTASKKITPPVVTPSLVPVVVKKTTSRVPVNTLIPVATFTMHGCDNYII